MMRPADVLAFVTRRPFQSFRIHLTDGTVYVIHHPELVMPGERTVIVGIPADPADRYFHHYETVALQHVVRLVPIGEPAGEQPAVASGGTPAAE